MKKLVLIGLMIASQACVARQYQVAMLAVKAQEMYYSIASNKADAEKKALVINATGQGEVVAWVQRAKPAPKVKKLKTLTLPKDLLQYAQR